MNRASFGADDSISRRTNSSTSFSAPFRLIAVCCPTNWPSTARGLAAIEKVGILSAAETQQTLEAIDEIAKRAAAEPAWLDRSPAEDVHHFVEMALVERLGPLGYKLHTARSRNELVATDFRMFVKDAVQDVSRAVSALIAALIGLAERTMGVPLAGMTHLQHAQPILFSHFLLAHAEAFFRDLERLAYRETHSRFMSAGLRSARRLFVSDRSRGAGTGAGFRAHFRQ